jgi:nucleotide-binding universal stress UspA family protein
MSPDEKPVVFAYDGSDQAKHAIEQAGVELRTPRKAVVVAAFEPLGAIPFWSGSRAIVPDELLESVREEAAKTAEEGAELARAAGFDATSKTEAGDRTWQAILDAAKEIDAGMIVLGSHGRGTVGSAVLGSVATAVAQHAHLPVMICRPAEAAA